MAFVALEAISTAAKDGQEMNLAVGRHAGVQTTPAELAIDRDLQRRREFLIRANPSRKAGKLPVKPGHQLSDCRTGDFNFRLTLR